MYADLAVLSADYITVPDNEIRRISSVLTVVGGRIVHGEDSYADLAPPLPPASPSWSPVNAERSPAQRVAALPAGTMACLAGCGNRCGMHGHDHGIAWATPLPVSDAKSFWGALGCSCFAV